MVTLWPNGTTSIPRVSSEFNPARKNPVTGIVQPHNGIDLIGFTDNKSPVDGKVIFAGYNGGAGNEVRIQGDDGNFYRLLHHASLYVKAGQRVTAGQAVGRMGTTGQSTGVHCHFETHYQRLWNYQNPRTFIANANSGAAGGETDDMPLNADTDYAAFATMLQRALRYDVRPNGMGVNWQLGPTVWERFDTIQGAVNGVPDKVKVTVTDAQAKQIADAIAASLDLLSDEDLARIAKATNDEAARRLGS